ncbi:MAG: hypothetical protein P4L44_09780 [Oryzomonas sp.]|uniref:hypothetical protein n=1 Tax=Oryzomonas sp. TaxID=2855186 RepID=UPI002841C2D3|nr:hypothetical protein [Oryzomonas sp.]MDR3580238.1 hypothetical protein [Oryzomonas sp.]
MKPFEQEQRAIRKRMKLCTVNSLGDYRNSTMIAPFEAEILERAVHTQQAVEQ